MKDKSKICIITTNKNAYSETFIRNHINKLPFEKTMLFNGLADYHHWESEKPLVNPNLIRLNNMFSKFNLVSQDSKTQLETTILTQFLKKNNTQAVLAEFGPVGVRVCEACQRAKIPLIVHFHGDDAHSQTFTQEFARGYQKLAHYAAAIVGVSEVMKKQLIDLGFPSKKVYKIPYGIDIDVFNNAQPDTNSPIFLAVGRFVDKKAPYFLILAFKKVLEQAPASKLIMVGDGYLLETCRALIKSFKLENNVKLMGARNSEQVVSLMKEARAFVQHSITPSDESKEGTPLSILEASATGLPVVSTRHAGIPEAIIHEKSGFLVDEFDIDKMSDYMAVLAKNPTLAASMGKVGREHIGQCYRLETQIQKLADVIQRCVDER